MGFRFRRSFKVVPGFRLNLSKSGVSGSVGRRGLWFTIGPRGTRETVGIPGTGISYTEQQSIDASPGDEAAPASSSGGGLLMICLIVFLVLVVGAIAFWTRS